MGASIGRAASGLLLSDILHIAIDVKNMDMLESEVAMAELESFRHPDTSPPHYFLASLYQQLPEDLSYEARRHIEDEKLRIEGKEGILEMPRDSTVILSNLGPNPTWEQRFSAAHDYIHSANILAYLKFGNVPRAVHHLERAMAKSRGDKNYENLLNTILVGFMLDERFHKYFDLIALHYRSFSGLYNGHS